MISNAIPSRKLLFLVLLLVVLAGCKNRAPQIIHSFSQDPLVVEHGTVVDLDVRFIDDRNELAKARVNFNGHDLYTGTDTIFTNKILTGELSAGTYKLSFYAEDLKENIHMDSLNIIVDPVIPSISDFDISNVRASEAKVKYNIISTGGVKISEQGLVFSIQMNPDTETSKILLSRDLVEIDKIVEGFPRNYELYVRAFATNKVGTSYSESIKIKTMTGIPGISTGVISDIHSKYVTAQGRLHSDGGADVTKLGVCYSTTPNPDIRAKKINSRAQNWNFRMKVEGLEDFTHYYYRSYVTNKYSTYYGQIKEFETTGPPTVVTGDQGRIMINSVEFNIDVKDNGGHKVIDLGMVYSMMKNPTIDSNAFSFGKGTGEYNGKVENLDPGSKYYFRAYAINSEGVGYGEIVELFTKIGIPVVKLSGIEEIDYSSARVVADVPDDGGLDIIERGITWDTIALPSRKNIYAEVEGTDGSFDYTIKGLVAGTRYWARAYAMNESGIVYSDAISFVPYISTPLVDIKGATFNMGSDDGDKTEMPVHQVTLSDYQIGTYEVSNLEFASFLNSVIDRVTFEGDGDIVNVDGIPVYHLKVYGEDYQKTGFKVHISFDGDKFFVIKECAVFPAVLVSWEGARMYCEWAGGRLPTEAEWEFAARGAKNSNNHFAGGSDIEKYAWYFRNSKDAACPLTDDSRGLNIRGGLEPNAIGLYDMSGNAAEWCYDYYANDYYQTSPLDNPMGPEKGITRVIRGGSWIDKDRECTVYRRIKSFDNIRGYDNISFRLVRKK